jgi:hypothetical protein
MGSGPHGLEDPSATQDEKETPLDWEMSGAKAE